MSETDLSEPESRAVAQLIREELARKRMTRQLLADTAKLSLSTLEKALSGQRPFTLATVVRLEQALAVPLRRQRAAEPAKEQGLAPPELGSYSRPAVNWLEGEYLTIRASFSNPAGVYTYLTELKWDSAASHLVFRESEREDAQFKQDGAVSVPHQSGYIYLVTNKHGQYRMAVLTRPMISGEMYGLITTLQSGRAGHLTPVCAPMVLVPLKSFDGAPAYGLLDEANPAFARCKAYLRRALEEPFVRLVGQA